MSNNAIREEAAKDSGFFQCPKCRLIWFGRYNEKQCPEGRHGKPIQVAVLCRECDDFIEIDRLAEHLTATKHKRTY